MQQPRPPRPPCSAARAAGTPAAGRSEGTAESPDLHSPQQQPSLPAPAVTSPGAGRSGRAPSFFVRPPSAGPEQRGSPQRGGRAGGRRGLRR
ncbi:unnamed protein product [Pipistrellus nathusii]|uniref:Uncharacterized protein n=1 Tax=Pipistrellus nathusii TaxID=59473 RepID=A0ABN9ZY73_PIPNA